ncbi:MAG: hypothetical protein AAFY57_09505 [Cyanobacteria bacterium J06642_2]
MNAVTQAITIELATKIAGLAALFRSEFPDVSIDLSPWLCEPQTQAQLDPYSIDMSFFFSSYCIGMSCYCVLMQVHFSESLQQPTCKLCKIEAHAFDRRRLKRWQFSSEHDRFEGLFPPDLDYQERFRHAIERVTNLFGQPERINSGSDTQHSPG